MTCLDRWTIYSPRAYICMLVFRYMFMVKLSYDASRRIFRSHEGRKEHSDFNFTLITANTEVTYSNVNKRASFASNSGLLYLRSRALRTVNAHLSIDMQHAPNKFRLHSTLLDWMHAAWRGANQSWSETGEKPTCDKLRWLNAKLRCNSARNDSRESSTGDLVAISHILR